MHAAIMAFIEFFIALLLGIIVVNVAEKKNLRLSLHLNLVILVIVVMKLFYLLYLAFHNMSLCEATRQLYCAGTGII